MSKFTNSTESTTDSTTTKIPSPYSDAPPASTPPVDDPNDLGYDTPPVTPPATVEPPKTEVPAPPAEEEKKLSGYGKETVEPPKTEVPPPPTTEEEKVKLELSEVVKDLPESLDKDKITKFALDNKLSKEQLSAYAALVKEDQVSFEKAQKDAVIKQRADWKKELISDPEFGGEHFDKNVDRVEKVLEKYMPNVKKVLTERGSMLPPYIMRDFLALSKVLNPVAPLVNGEAGAPPVNDKNFLDDMYQ